MTSDDLKTMLEEDGQVSRRLDMSAVRQAHVRAAARELLAAREGATLATPPLRLMTLRVRPVLAAAAALIAAALLSVYLTSRTRSDDARLAVDVDRPAAQDVVAQVPNNVSHEVAEEESFDDMGPLVPMAWPPPPPRVWNDRPASLDSFSQRLDRSGRAIFPSGAPFEFESRSSTLKGRIRNATRDVRYDLYDLDESRETTRGQWWRNDITLIIQA